MSGNTKDTSNPPVALDANSLYVATQTLMSPGYHWAIFITDSEGVPTRHHWSAWQGGTYAERYTSQIINPARTYTSNCVMLTYCKVAGYTAPKDIEPLCTLLSVVFDAGYTTVKDNRKNSYTCRTWVLAGLRSFQKKGYIVRSDDVGSIEKVVLDYSAAEEKKMVEVTGVYLSGRYNI
jgi:hypothetical protein